MSKELEALEEIRDFRYGEDKLLVCQTEMYDIIKKALKRLESIDNAKPSKALTEIFNIIYSLDCGTTYEQDKKLDECRNTIKQALLKAQEQEKVLEIIKENQVSTFWINECKSVEEYNGVYGRKLTKEEFDLLKRCIE